MELAAFSMDLDENMAGASFVKCFRCFRVESFSPSVVWKGFISSSSAGGEDNQHGSNHHFVFHLPSLAGSGFSGRFSMNGWPISLFRPPRAACDTDSTIPDAATYRRLALVDLVCSIPYLRNAVV